jgi:hypothetical protein
MKCGQAACNKEGREAVGTKVAEGTLLPDTPGRVAYEAVLFLLPG